MSKHRHGAELPDLDGAPAVEGHTWASLGPAPGGWALCKRDINGSACQD